MHKWELECSISLSAEEWKDSINNLRKCTISLTVRETATKLFTRWYYTPNKLHTFSLQYLKLVLEDVYRRALSHIFSGTVKKYHKYGKIQETSPSVSQAFRYPLNYPIVCYSCLSQVSPFNHHMRLIQTISVSIQWLVAFHWKSPSVPLMLLKTRINNIIFMEKLYHTLYNTMRIYNKKMELLV